MRVCHERSDVIGMSDQQFHSTVPGGVSTSEQAVDIARNALEAVGHDDATVSVDPHRTRGTWVVQATTDEGRFNVHIDAADGSTSVAKLGV